MNYKLTVMLLAILALLWRGYTSYSYYQVGRVGVSQDANGVITKIGNESPALAAGLQTGDKIIDITGLVHPQDRPLIGQKLTYNISREGKEQLIEVIGLHHLDRAACQTERHPHERTGARPVDEFIGGGDDESLIRQLVGEFREIGGRFSGGPCSACTFSTMIKYRCGDQFHSSAPLRHS